MVAQITRYPHVQVKKKAQNLKKNATGDDCKQQNPTNGNPNAKENTTELRAHQILLSTVSCAAHQGKRIGREWDVQPTRDQQYEHPEMQKKTSNAAIHMASVLKVVGGVNDTQKHQNNTCGNRLTESTGKSP